MHIRTNKTLNVLFRPVLIFCEWLGKHFPKLLVRMRYFVRFHRRLNLKEPKTLNEKILYLSLRTDTTLWTTCADKYAVREYIKSCGLEDTLVKLYGLWDKVDDIDFSKLPDEYTIKTTNGCGDVTIVQDNHAFDPATVLPYYAKELSKRYGALEGGIHYMRIQPRLIIEELLHNDAEALKYSTSIIDYKIWCFNGKAHYILTCSNRTKEGLEIMTYDRDWNAHPEYSIFNNEYRKGMILPKPKNFEQMLLDAEKLAEPFACVRVDLYNLNGKIYFGELTFTSLGGLMNYYTEEFQLLAGSMIDLSGVKTID
ncbi:MAG: glycosyltransferase [Paludibacteraceae bacterium]|nr:glycosyltransferase [Paludibacteraceae bacterium]